MPDKITILYVDTQTQQTSYEFAALLERLVTVITNNANPRARHILYTNAVYNTDQFNRLNVRIAALNHARPHHDQVEISFLLKFDQLVILEQISSLLLPLTFILSNNLFSNDLVQFDLNLMLYTAQMLDESKQSFFAGIQRLDQLMFMQNAISGSNPYASLLPSLLFVLCLTRTATMNSCSINFFSNTEKLSQLTQFFEKNTALVGHVLSDNLHTLHLHAPFYSHILYDISLLSKRLLFPIAVTNTPLLEQLGQERGFTYLPDPLETQAGQSMPLHIAPVAVLTGSALNLGVFATQPIESGQIIGHYMGNKISLNLHNQSTCYLFEVDSKQNEGIDASTIRNWTSFVNHSKATPNVQAYLENNTIVYKTIRAITTHEQLLIDYGNNYDFRHVNHLRFLKSTDSSLESNEILTQNLVLYKKDPQLLSPNIANSLYLPTETYFKIPYFDDLMPFAIKPQLHEVNAVLIAVDKQKKPLPQAQQENITALMCACITNRTELITYLLVHGANPNNQSSILGHTALHLVITATLPIADKQIVIELLRSYGAKLDVCNKDNQSVLAFAALHAPELTPILGQKLKSDEKRFFKTTMRRSPLFFNTHATSLYDHFKIITTQQLSPANLQEQLITLINDSQFTELSEQKQQTILKYAIKFNLDYADWFTIAYQLHIVGETEAPDVHDQSFIRLTRESKHPAIYHYDCVGLNEQRLEGTISVVTYPSLQEVITQISRQGEDISDQTRLSKAELLVKHAEDYSKRLAPQQKNYQKIVFYRISAKLSELKKTIYCQQNALVCVGNP